MLDPKELVKLSKEVAKTCERTGVIAFGCSGTDQVHLTEEAFRETFCEYSVRPFMEDRFELSQTVDGTIFFTLVNNEPPKEEQ